MPPWSLLKASMKVQAKSGGNMSRDVQCTQIPMSELSCLRCRVLGFLCQGMQGQNAHALCPYLAGEYDLRVCLMLHPAASLQVGLVEAGNHRRRLRCTTLENVSGFAVASL